ncbi:efflux RND transporter periplasmic adaptor subunit [Flavobacterium sp. CS20]|uniref:efflux RND transporter periplasmic adaptor subunit n=1 Tax=Flavobacterium sp. CS20 TaxID=2775246 RepID=UPI001B3A54EE|nr:efflux RND transporter periplasmic adaptor subunit [Flavobacterium sp. CS20]QTY26441.1 efflux RND transporter periplasmic adaptor subunit [Flavobacterium sp. CS20]
MKKYKNYIIAAGILILGIILGNVFSGGSSETTHADGEHEYVQDKETGLWTCSMHPQIRMEEPGNCPICGMELIPLEEDNGSSENIATNEIVMNEEAYQLANIQTTIVEKASAIKEIRLLGRVKPDERRLYSQVSHIPGRIERLYVNFTGEKVYRGQKIVRIYSPELISAQKELFEAIKSKDIYPQLYTASRNKLKLWKLSDKQIDAIEATGNVQEQIDILSDHTGYVMNRNVELGDYIKAGGNLFDIANLSSVWVMFEAYEADIPWIHINDKVSFTIQAIPSKTFEGKVTYVDPFVSPNTRVAKVRVEVKNPSNTLLPEMYASGIIQAKMKGMENAIVIPKSAVLWIGKRAVVYVKVPHDKTISFVYREIELGQDMGQFYIVQDGLEEGEVVATNGVFRIDASAQLLVQKSMMNPEGGKVSTVHNHGGMPMGDDANADGVDHSKMDMSDSKKDALKRPYQNGK